MEHELEQAGVALLAADEPFDQRAGHGHAPRKNPTATLARWVEQAIAEWYVLQMLELSWNGFHEHTAQGWNIGRPPYGYKAEKPPILSWPAEPRAKPKRLIPDP
jgi:hypothetical protein